MTSEKQVETVSLLTGEIKSLDFQLTPDCTLENHEESDVGHVSDTMVFSCHISVRLLVSALSDHRMVNTEGSLHRTGVVAGQQHFALIRQSDKSFKLFNTVSGRFSEVNYRDHVLNIWGDCFLSSSSDLDFDCTFLRHGADDQVSMIQRGKSEAKWAREEALQNIVSAQLIDLPPNNAIEVDPYTWTFSQRVGIQLQLMKAWLATTLAEIETGAFFQSPTRDPLVNEPGLIRDQFNLHKVIVLATKSGSVFGLDSLDGSIIWKRYFPQMRGCVLHTVLSKDTNINYGSVAVTAKCGESGAHLVRLDPVNGREIGRPDDLKGNVLRVERMASMTSEQNHALLVIR